MSLDVDVMPAVISTLKGVKGLHGVSWGPKLNIQETPWAWAQLASFNQPDSEGSDLEATDWVILVRLFMRYATDNNHAERTLAGLIEPIRAAFRTNIRLGKNPAIARALATQGAAGYMEVSAVEYRYIDLNVMVREKRAVAYSA